MARFFSLRSFDISSPIALITVALSNQADREQLAKLCMGNFVLSEGSYPKQQDFKEAMSKAFADWDVNAFTNHIHTHSFKNVAHLMSFVMGNADEALKPKCQMLIDQFNNINTLLHVADNNLDQLDDVKLVDEKYFQESLEMALKDVVTPAVLESIDFDMLKVKCLNSLRPVSFYSIVDVNGHSVTTIDYGKLKQYVLRQFR